VRLHCLDVVYHLRWRGPPTVQCAHRCARGEELGWFEHGSTIIVFAPAGFSLAPGIEAGKRIRMGEPLMRRPND
jgi:phosphatidylserine decarboxylase